MMAEKSIYLSAPGAISEMPKEEFDMMMETGLAQAKKGESLDADEVFDELLRNI